VLISSSTWTSDEQRVLLGGRHHLVREGSFDRTEKSRGLVGARSQLGRKKGQGLSDSFFTLITPSSLGEEFDGAFQKKRVELEKAANGGQNKRKRKKKRTRQRNMAPFHLYTSVGKD